MIKNHLMVHNLLCPHQDNTSILHITLCLPSQSKRLETSNGYFKEKKKINPSSLLIKLVCKYLYSFTFGDRLCYSSTGLRPITKFKLAMTSWSSCPHLSIASTWDSTWALVHDGYYCTIKIYPQLVATIFKLYQKAKKKKKLIYLYGWSSIKHIFQAEMAAMV